MRRGEIQRTIIGMLINEPEGISPRECLSALAEKLTPTEFELSYYENNPTVRRFENRARFATVILTKAGWLAKSDGLWFATNDGITAYNSISSPEKFSIEAGRLYKVWAKNEPTSDAVEHKLDNDSSANTTTMEDLFELANISERANEQIEDHLSSMLPYDVQKLVSSLLQAMDYHVSWNSPPGKDQGIDLIAHSDPLGAKSARIKVQVKRTQVATTADQVKSFMQVVGEREVGIYFSTGGYTSDAKALVRNDKNGTISLIDRKHLIKLWIEFYDKIDDEGRKLLPLRKIYFLADSKIESD